jgi:internalin A
MLSGSNEITKLPESIGQLRYLGQIYLNHNRLMGVPSTLAQMTNLRVLELHGNDGLSLPAEVLRPDRPADILEYYFRTRGEARPLNEAKLILVGFGNVGKTCLVNRLLYEKFDAREQKTEGINICEWLVTVGEGENVRLHV